MVFGKAIINAQVYLLQYISPRSKILVAGGGTGWILEELTRVYPSGLKITYVEISAKMMEISAKRKLGKNEVTFINSAVEGIDFPSDFDVILTPFLFDNFSHSTAQNVFTHLNAALNYNGLWLYADFETTGKWWQKTLLKTMLLFFKLLCDIEARQLADVKTLFKSANYTAINSETFFGGFVRATAYTRPS